MKIFTGGYPGAGKTTLARYLVRERGWCSLDMDQHGTNPVLELLTAPTGHEAFAQEPLVVEGGFLHQATDFQRMIERHGLVTFWLTGTFEQLRDSRLARKAPWDDPQSIVGGGWMKLVDTYASKVRWDHTIRMWDADGNRKTTEEIVKEILDALTPP